MRSLFVIMALLCAAPAAAQQPPSPHPGLDLLEKQANHIRERVFRTKATLLLLRDLLVDPSAGQGRLTLTTGNELPSGWDVEAVTVYVDGRSVHRSAVPGGALNGAVLQVHDRMLPPGPHRLEVELELRWNGLVGRNGPVVHARSLYEVDLAPKERSAIHIAPRRMRAPVPFLERVTVGWQESVADLDDLDD